MKVKMYNNLITKQIWVEYPPKKDEVLSQIIYYPQWIGDIFSSRQMTDLSGGQGIIRRWELSSLAENFLCAYDRLRGKGFLWFRLFNCGKWYVKFLPGEETKQIIHAECLYKIPLVTLQLPPDIYSVRRSQVAALFSDAAFRGIIELWEPSQKRIDATDKMYTSYRHASLR